MALNYLNNKDILKEIHESKNTYCFFTKKEFHRYDLIIDRPDFDLTANLAFMSKPAQIKLAKEARATRLSIELGQKIEPKSISQLIQLDKGHLSLNLKQGTAIAANANTFHAIAQDAKLYINDTGILFKDEKGEYYNESNNEIKGKLY